MWVVSRLGFFSIVENFTIEGHFLVRSRVRADLAELLAEADVNRKINFKTGTDYEFRVTVSAAELTKIFVTLEASINYSNFKAAIGTIPRQKNRSGIYHQVWELFARNLARLGRGGKA